MPKSSDVPNELFKYEREKRHWTQGDVADKIGAPDERLIRRWERGEVAPTPHYRSKLAEVFGKSAKELGFPPAGELSFWYTPYRRNAFFTGREDILHLLHDTFLAQQASRVPRLPLALSGLAGVGKSQIALEYAYRYREHYHTVLWLRADLYQQLVAGFTAVAALLGLPEKDAAEPDQVIEAVKAWLSRLTRWLLIFDNVEKLQLLEDFLPAEIKGHVLLTTLSQNTGTHAQRIAVEPMDSNTGAELLLRRAQLLARENTLEHMAEADATIARSLSEDMGGLPLALDQAGAYIEETAVSLSEYEQRYQKERRNLLDRRGSWAGDSEHPLPVATTFNLSFDKAGEQHPLAMDILRFCAFLSPDAIPEELFQHYDSFKYGTTLFDEAIAALLRYSLIKRNTEAQTCSLHRLVQAVLIDGMPHDVQKQWQARVMQALNAAFPAFPDVEFKNWSQCERLLSHVLTYVAWTEGELNPSVGVAELFRSAGVYLLKRMQYSEETELLLMRALSITEQYQGAEHPDTVTSLRLLAVLYWMRGKYSQAEPFYLRTLAIQEKHLGAEHPDTVKILHSLATLYCYQGKFAQAERLYKQALSIQEKHLGAEHPEIAVILYKLANLYEVQHEYETAEPFYLRALAIQEKHLGAEHPDTVKILHSLANLYTMQGKYEQAEFLHLRALAIQEKHLGAEHPDTVTILDTLAVLYHCQGKYEQAELMYRRVIRIWEKLMGPEHPSIAPPLLGLVELLHVQGKHEQAETLYQRALSINKQWLGATHPFNQEINKAYTNLLRSIGGDSEAAARAVNDEPSV